MLYTSYHLEIHNRDSQHFGLLIASSYTAFQTEDSQLRQEAVGWIPAELESSARFTKEATVHPCLF